MQSRYPRRSARAGRRAAPAGTQPASRSARSPTGRAQGRGGPGTHRAVSSAPLRHAAYGHAARPSAVERVAERHDDELRGRVYTLAGRRGHAVARGFDLRRVGSVLLHPRSRKRAFWSSGFQPSGREADSYEVTFAPDRAVIRRRDEGIETFTEVTVSPEDDAEIRRVSVTNHSREIPRARADQLRRGRARAPCRRPRAPCLQQPLHRVDAGAGAGRRHLHAGGRARTNAGCTWDTCWRGAGALARASSSRPTASISLDEAGPCDGHRRSSDPLRCRARPAPCSIRSRA